MAALLSPQLQRTNIPLETNKHPSHPPSSSRAHLTSFFCETPPSSIPHLLFLLFLHIYYSYYSYNSISPFSSLQGSAYRKMLYVKLATALYARAHDATLSITKRAAEDEVALKSDGQIWLVGLFLLNMVIIIPVLLYVSHPKHRPHLNHRSAVADPTSYRTP